MNVLRVISIHGHDVSSDAHEVSVSLVLLRGQVSVYDSILQGQTTHLVIQSTQDSTRIGVVIRQYRGVSTRFRDVIYMIDHCCPFPLQIHPNLLTKPPAWEACHGQGPE